MTTETAFSSLEFRQDLGIIFFRWLTSVNTEEFKAGYLQVFEAGLAKNCNCWVFDTRRRGSATLEAEKWYFDTYIPLLSEKLDRPHYIAVLHTPAHYVHIRDVIGFETFTQHTKGTPLTMEFFDSEQKAVDWLMRTNK